MDIKEIMAKIKAAAGEDVSPKIESFLRQIEAEFATVADDLKAANAESKERKLKLRELQTQLDEAGEKVKDYEGKVNDPALKQELETLRQFKGDVLKARRGTFSAEFGDVTKHANFDKAKEQFKLPKPTDAGEYDFSKLSDADIEHNMAKLDEYRKIGYFAADPVPPPAGPYNMPRSSGSVQPPRAPRTPEELQAHIAQQLSQYK